MIVNCTKSYIVSLHAYLIQLTNYMYSNLCDVVVVRVLSSGFCSNWTSRTDHGNLHWSRNDLIVEGIQSHCPIALYIVYVYHMYAEASKSYRIEFPLYLMLLNSIIGVRLTQYLAVAIKLKLSGNYCVRTNSWGVRWSSRKPFQTGWT